MTPSALNLIRDSNQISVLTFFESHHHPSTDHQNLDPQKLLHIQNLSQLILDIDQPRRRSGGLRIQDPSKGKLTYLHSLNLINIPFSQTLSWSPSHQTNHHTFNPHLNSDHIHRLGIHRSNSDDPLLKQIFNSSVIGSTSLSDPTHLTTTQINLTSSSREDGLQLSDQEPQPNQRPQNPGSPTPSIDTKPEPSPSPPHSHLDLEPHPPLLSKTSTLTELRMSQYESQVDWEAVDEVTDFLVNEQHLGRTGNQCY